MRRGGFGDYYLAQLQAGNLIDSPCIDSGTGSIRDLDEYNIGRVTTSTSITYQPDRGVIDMGYHFLEPDTADPNWVTPLFQLTVTTIGNGSVVPTGVNFYPFNTNVNLTATPTPGYRVKEWTGTDDDYHNGACGECACSCWDFDCGYCSSGDCYSSKPNFARSSSLLVKCRKGSIYEV